MKTNITETQKQFVSTAKEMFGENTTEVTRQDVIKMINDKGVKYPVWLLKSPTYRIGRGQYKLPTFNESMAQTNTESDSE
jgi:hypothetical protein|tara:strand:+ start:114 stop:353 length:240 start_codon:yes stop_codon:yes gene_type:complete